MLTVMPKLFKSKNPKYEHLRKKWTAKHKAVTEGLFDKHLKKVALGSLGGLMLLTTPGFTPQPGTLVASDHEVKISGSEDKNLLMAAELKDKVPDDVRPLTVDEEKRITEVLQKDTGIKSSGELEGVRLNRSYGLIGGEQHLYRYPGDTVFAHAESAQDWAMYGSSGIAPHVGAWGYFAPSKEAFTKEDSDRERWYIAVQTFLSPGFAENTAKYRDFYKYRKMLIVNPQTGQAVVADIADAGPSEWTGKHLGGSPEVMEAVGLAKGPRKGAVLYFFVDDPDNKVPLGPVKITDNMLASR